MSLKGHSKNQQLFRITLVALDCLVVGMQPILIHMSKDSDGKYSYSPVSVNFLIEVFKLIFSTCTLFSVDSRKHLKPLIRSFSTQAYQNRLLMVPASLYAISNCVKFFVQLYFRPTTAKMLGNLKIFTIAVMMRTLLGRRFTLIQWEALFLLVCGITINQLPSCTGSKVEEPFTLIAGLFTLFSVTVPAMASVFNEFALKKHMDTSVHVQNFFLYFYGMVFNGLGLILFSLAGGGSLSSLLSGHTAITVLLIANNAIQGILSSFFLKFADTILKKYSSAIATLFTAIMSAVLFGHSVSLNFLVGVLIVLISMHQFFTFGDKTKKNGMSQPGSINYSPSLDHIAAANNLSDKQKHILPV